MKRINCTVSNDAHSVLREFQKVNCFKLQDEALDELLKDYDKVKNERT